MVHPFAVLSDSSDTGGPEHEPWILFSTLLGDAGQNDM
jgi:hypothetical protein